MVKVIGNIENPEKKEIVNKLIAIFSEKYPLIECEAYCGFPIYVEEFSNKRISIDLALMTRRGAFFVNILETAVTNYAEIQDDIYVKLEGKFKKYPALIKQRKLIFPFWTITFCKEQMEEIEENLLISSPSDFLPILAARLESQDWNDEKYKKVISGMQEAYGLNSIELRNDIKQNTKAFYIQQLRNCIDKHDSSQMQAILADPSGIQRIRGMAGSGKTVILARKAVELHIAHPDWDIVVVYSTRSLKKQLEYFINKFYSMRKDGEKINEKKLRIMQTWGGANSPGLYYEICLRHHIPPYNYNTAKTAFRGYENVFIQVCKSLLVSVKAFEPMYDCILIDEAQDFDKNFFKLCYNVLKSEKRLIYAYDELQSLNEETMPEPQELFGKTISSDTPLSVCYRNQSKTIVTAHAIGMGLYREGTSILDRLIQIPDINVWSVIGYTCDTEIENGKKVILKRTKETSPDFLQDDIHEIVDFISYEDNEKMLTALLKMLKDDIEKEQLTPKDIMIIDMDKFYYSSNRRALSNKNFLENIAPSVEIHTAGTYNPEDFFRDDSIVYSSVRRAKGNEAFMVYIINAQECISNLTKRSDRNALFTAITRSKGWTKVLGYGKGMDELCAEFNKVKENDYQLVFDPYPTEEEQKALIINNKEVSDKDASLVKSLLDSFKRQGFSNAQIIQDLLKNIPKEELIKTIEEIKNGK